MWFPDRQGSFLISPSGSSGSWTYQSSHSVSTKVPQITPLNTCPKFISSSICTATISVWIYPPCQLWLHHGFQLVMCLWFFLFISLSGTQQLSHHNGFTELTTQCTHIPLLCTQPRALPLCPSAFHSCRHIFHRKTVLLTHSAMLPRPSLMHSLLQWPFKIKFVKCLVSLQLFKEGAFLLHHNCQSNYNG